MESRILKVFYDNQCYPFKDKERAVRYPIIGNTFTGASETTKIRFYVKDIGGVENVTWVAVVKLPNGKIGFKILSTIGNDLEVGERYVEFSLNSFYTQYNGDLAIALKGYQGNIQVEEDDDTGIYEIVGTPTIQATGVIKLSVNYSTQLPVTQGLSLDEFMQVMALLAEKLNIASGIVVLLNDSEDISGYTNGQLFYVVSRNQFMQLVVNELEERELKVYNVVPGQQATMSIIANPLTNVNGRVLSAYESTIVTISDYQCYKITRGGANLTEEYASRYMEYMTGSKYLPKYDYDYPKNTYLITPTGLILKPQYDSTNGLLLFPMSNLATRDYVDNDILEITSTSTPLTYEQRQKVLTNNVRIKYNNFLYEKVSQIGHNARFECANLIFTTNVDGSTTISQRFIVARDDTGSITESIKELYTYSKAQADQYFAHNVEMSVDSNYILKVKLIDKNGNQLAEDSVDLPLESIVQSAQYYETYTYQGTTYEDVIVITLATTSVPTIIPVGDLVSGLVSESTYNSGMATKVDKTNSVMKLYGTNGSGNQDTINYGSAANGNNIVQRDSAGQVFIPETPTRNLHATSKVYVDAFAKDIELSLDQSTYVLTVTLKNANGGNIVTRTIDLPLETMVVGGTYDEINKAIILTLKNGQTISIPVGDLISGLVSTDYLQANYYNKTQIDQMVSGFVFADVDDNLSSVSTNPVENRVITQALEEKANVDGNYPTMTVGVADNLSPYDEDSGDDQDEPFSLQATGTGNGSQPDFSTGSYALIKEKRGNTVVVNQQVANRTTTTTVNGITVTVNADGSLSISGTATAPAYVVIAIERLNIKQGHKYLSFGIQLNVQEGGSAIYYIGTPYHVFGNYEIWEATTDSDDEPYLYVSEGTTFNETKINPKIIDLTQWFGSNDNIPAHLLAHPEDFFRYYQGSLAYNEGELVNANGRYLKTIGRNQWDEEWELGGINATTGQNESSNDNIRSKNYIKVIPNANYYFRTNSKTLFVNYYDKDKNQIDYGGINDDTKVIPANCCYIRFRLNGTTYQNDITISLYYEGESGYDQYYSYQVLTNNDTGTEILRSAGSVHDSKAPDGTITRRIGPYTFTGSESWIFNEGNQMWVFDIPQASAKTLGSTLASNGILFAIYQNAVRVYLSDNPQLTSSTNMNDIFPNGTVIHYELAEPTTEQGTSYSENVAIDDFGSMDFGGTNGVPQGNLIFYPVDYKAFVDTLYNYTEGTPSNFTRNSDLDAKFESYLKSLSGYNASETQVLKNVNGTLTWVTEGE